MNIRLNKWLNFLNTTPRAHPPLPQQQTQVLMQIIKLVWLFLRKRQQLSKFCYKILLFFCRLDEDEALALALSSEINAPPEPTPPSQHRTKPRHQQLREKDEEECVLL